MKSTYSIQTGKPQQNAYIEYSNRSVKYERLSQHYWESISEAQEFAVRWMCKHYYHPKTALGSIILKQLLTIVA